MANLEQAFEENFQSVRKKFGDLKEILNELDERGNKARSLLKDIKSECDSFPGELEDDILFAVDTVYNLKEKADSCMIKRGWSKDDHLDEVVSVDD